ncbi:hypothetical protein DKP78_15790, partial [Enterococcus faecium]
RKPITVEVWNSNAVKDQFMGQVVLTADLNDKSGPQKLQLRKRGSQAANEMPGTVTLRVVSARELTAM